MSTSAQWMQLGMYLIVTYAVATLVMSHFAGSTDEIFAFGAWVWAIPALIALAFRNRPTLAGQYRISLISLVTLVGLAWTTMFVFEATY